MEQDQPLDSGFDSGRGLELSATIRDHLRETARWARFLAIIGFVLIGLMLIIALIGLMLPSMSGLGGLGSFYSAGVFVGYFLVALIYLLPLLYLFRFASKMQLALRTEDNMEMEGAFANIKAHYRFIGILTIILLALYGLIFLFAMLGMSAFLG